jgi:hypothetical protein
MLEDFYHTGKIQRLRPGVEPANSGFRGQHKGMSVIVLVFCIEERLDVFLFLNIKFAV